MLPDRTDRTDERLDSERVSQTSLGLEEASRETPGDHPGLDRRLAGNPSDRQGIGPRMTTFGPRMTTFMTHLDPE